MTKKDYEAIAKCLDANHAPLSLVLDFADMLAEDNERFNRRVFVAASTNNLAKIIDHDHYMLSVAHGKA